MINVNTVYTISMEDFLDYFASTVNEDVLNSFQESLLNSEYSFGSNADTLVTLEDAVDMIYDNAPEFKIEDIFQTFQQLRQDLGDRKVYLSLGC